MSCLYHVYIMYIHVYIMYISCIYHVYIMYISNMYIYISYIHIYMNPNDPHLRENNIYSNSKKGSKPCANSVFCSEPWTISKAIQVHFLEVAQDNGKPIM